MKKKKPITIEDHQELAAEMRGIMQSIRNVEKRLWLGLPLQSRPVRLAERLDTVAGRLRGALDRLYHSTISNAEFQEYGHVYYTGRRARKRCSHEEANRMFPVPRGRHGAALLQPPRGMVLPSLPLPSGHAIAADAVDHGPDLQRPGMPAARRRG